ncbi:MAG TPA: carbamoyltransferase [Chitinophagaceae bacterium]|nr:carbamoyltransferase [Chitinophagaceae bacterium]
MTLLGISAFYHDAAAALIRDGVIIAAAQEERFTRVKHDKSFPAGAIRYCLQEAGVGLNDLDAVAFYDKPFLKFERLLETYYAFAPRGIASFLTSIPGWIREKIFIKKILRRELARIDRLDSRRLRLLFPEHHLSHAASTFYASGFQEAAILTIDGVGEWATTTLSHGRGQSIEVLKELRFPHSVGLLYSAFTYYLGFTVNSDEYKLMGLAPYGDPGSGQTHAFREKIRTQLVSLAGDGSVHLNQQYFRYAYGLRMVDDRKMERLFGFPRRQPGAPFEQHHLDLALAIQEVTEDIVLKMAAHARELTGSPRLCLAGGVALNCVANGKIQRAGLFEELFIQPAAGDAGGALGAALAAYHIFFDGPRVPASRGEDLMQGAYLGPAFTEQELEAVARQHASGPERIDSLDELCRRVAALLDQGLVIGWFQGRMEFGPRALGNRSILGDPRNPDMQKKLNLKIKNRESFRPFAPAVMLEESGTYFEMTGQSPYMLLVHPVRESIRNALPPGYHQLPLTEKLYTVRSSLPAITHVDFSARIQTVTSQSNPRFYALLEAFRQRTGLGMLINTSFNVRDEPIVCTPQEAYRCFLATDMDCLVLGNYLLHKPAGSKAGTGPGTDASSQLAGKQE